MTEGVKHSLNPFDEIAVEEAVRMKEKSYAVKSLLYHVDHLVVKYIVNYNCLYLYLFSLVHFIHATF